MHPPKVDPHAALMPYRGVDVYISVNGEIKGPFSRGEILDGLQNGAFSKDDLCAQEGWPEWRTLSDVYKKRPYKSEEQSVAEPPPITRAKQEIKRPALPKVPAWRNQPVTTAQIRILKDRGEKIPGTKGEASDIISHISRRQRAVLNYFGYTGTLEYSEAKAILDAIHHEDFAEKRAEWDAVKYELYPHLYNPDGSPKTNKKNRNLIRAFFWLSVILFVISAATIPVGWIFLIPLFFLCRFLKRKLKRMKRDF